MKIIRNDKVFVQNKDLKKTMSGSICYNAGIPNEVIGKVFTNSFEVNDDNYRDFVCFEDKESIDFFNKLDFIVDYDKVMKLDERKIVNLIKETIGLIREVCNNANKNGVNSLMEFNKKMEVLHLLEHRFYDLRTILWNKKGLIKIDIPYELTAAYKVKNAFCKKKRNDC